MSTPPKFDPETKTFAIPGSGTYVQVYNQMTSHVSLADLNFFDGVRDLEDLKKMRDVMNAVITELEVRKGTRELIATLQKKKYL